MYSVVKAEMVELVGATPGILDLFYPGKVLTSADI